MGYYEKFLRSGLSYAFIALKLGCCEQSARNKIKGITPIRQLEKDVLDEIFKEDDENAEYNRTTADI